MDWGYVAGYFDGEGSAKMFGSKRRIASMAWHNTHLESLERIRDFVGCGNIRQRGRTEYRYKPMYSLFIERRQDIIRVCRAMLPLLIVKRDDVLVVLDHAENKMTDQAPGRGALGKAGPEVIRRLYWDERLSQGQIADRFGVSRSAVRNFMKRNGIPLRTRSEMSLLQWKANMSDEGRKSHSLAMADKMRRQWEDPDFRTARIAAVREYNASRRSD